MPFLAPALGIAMQNSPGVLPLLAAARAFYSAHWSWRIREIPVRAAVRLEPEADFLWRHIPDYNLKLVINI
jgi:hypothetical protein